MIGIQSKYSIVETSEDLSPDKNITIIQFVIPNIQTDQISETKFCKNYPNSNKAYKFEGFIYQGQCQLQDFGIFVNGDGTINAGFIINLSLYIWKKIISRWFRIKRRISVWKSSQSRKMDLKYTSKMKRIIERGTIFEDEYKKGKKSGYGILIWNKMVTNIQAYFKMINLMVLEYIILQMDLFMKING